MTCRLCRADTDSERCADHDACAKRARQNMRRQVSTMKQIPLSKERQQQLYREAMGR